MILSLVAELASGRTGDGPGSLREALADAYLWTGKDGTVLAANRRAARIAGHRPDALVGTSITSWFLSVDHVRVRDLLDTPGPDVRRASLVLADGRDAEIAVAWNAGPDDEVTAHWLVRVADPPAGEPDLGLPVATYTCRTGSLWSCVSMSPRLEQLVGVAADRFVDDPVTWLELVDPADRERLIETRLRMTSAGTTMSCVYRMRGPDSRTVWVRDEAVMGADGLAHGIILDASIEHQRDEVLVQLHESSVQEVQRLRAAATARDVLFRTFAHDIRTAAVGGRTLLQALTDEHGRSAPDEAVAALDALIQVMELAHGVSELEARREHLDVRPVDLQELARSVIARIPPDDHRVALDVRAATVDVDPVVVARMLSNLVTNAVRHTPAGTTIRVTGERTERGLLLRVEDDGPGGGGGGGPDSTGPHLPVGRDSDGLGLGLRLVRQLADLHGGEVWAEELLTGGMSFAIALPQRPRL